MPKTALFCVDIQNDLAGEGFPNTSPHAERIRKNGTEILKRVRKAIEDAEKENRAPPLELVFVQHEEPEGPLVRGTDTWKLVFEPAGERKTEKLVSKTDGL
jgi:nicotinamidase-related amidase